MPITLILIGAVFVSLASPPTTAGAASTNRALVLAETVTGGTSSIEATEAAADGLTVDLVDAATWSSMTAEQFASYQVIILGDPTCEGPPATSAINTAAANASTWEPVVNGNIVILGTDPVFHANQGGELVTRRGVDFALNQVGKTGAYISLSCYYHETAPGTPVPLLNSIGSGGFTVTGVGCYNNAHIVAESPALAGLTDADLSNWSCSVHEAFQTWPGSLVPLAIARDFDSSYTASDGTTGPPYILAGGAIQSFPLSVSPLIDSAAVGGTHSVTAQLLDATTRDPVAGVKIGFSITTGPNAGAGGACAPIDCLTDSGGHVAFTYSSNGTPGADTIQAYVDQNGNNIADVGEPETTAGMSWTAEDHAPIAALSLSQSTGPIGLPVRADASASTDTDATPIASYIFDFGDGTIVESSSTEPLVMHTYIDRGAFTVTVTVTDSAGLSNAATASVNVAPEAGAKKTGICKRFRLVVFSAEWSGFDRTEVPFKYRKVCWGYVKPRDQDPSAPDRCGWARSSPGAWGYNEIASVASNGTTDFIKRDRKSIRACHAYVDGRTDASLRGSLFYAYDASRRHWETTGHVPPGVGAVDPLLELYVKQDVVSGRAFADWKKHYSKQFAAIVNFAAPRVSDATAARWVGKLCSATAGNGTMGLYAGSGERKQFSDAEWKSRLTAVWEAMAQCTLR